MMKLHELAEQAVTFVCSTLDTDFSVEEIYRLLDVRGTRNSHLANPLNRDPNVYYFRARLESFSGNELVYGDFLSLTYCGHDPFVILQDYDDLKSLEASLLSDSGATNPFITAVAAFVDFRLRIYRIEFRQRNGSVVTFSKTDQENGVYSARETYEDRKIEWTPH